MALYSYGAQRVSLHACACPCTCLRKKRVSPCLDLQPFVSMRRPVAYIAMAYIVMAYVVMLPHLDLQPFMSMRRLVCRSSVSPSVAKPPTSRTYL